MDILAAQHTYIFYKKEVEQLSFIIFIMCIGSYTLERVLKASIHLVVNCHILLFSLSLIFEP